MLIEKDTYNVSIENDTVSIALYSSIGSRVEQQDRAGYRLVDSGCVLVLCDGMGGHMSGRKASTEAIKIFFSKFESLVHNSNYDYEAAIFEAMQEMNRAVREIVDDNGEWARAGSTAVAVVVKDGLLHWGSVGDSRIYVIRNNDMNQLTTDHIYKNILDKKMRLGEISNDMYEKEMENCGVLTSFLGVGDSIRIDCGNSPIMSGDQIILMSDGLYKIVDDKSIFSLLCNFSNASDALCALEYEVRSRARDKKILRDNMTLALAKIK